MTRNEKLLRDHRERAECLGKSLSSVNQIVFAAERVNSCLERTVSPSLRFNLHTAAVSRACLPHAAH